ncbi:hypothetical protein ACFFLM_19165 [Deinococcus oregonensis]|uniref:Uncharacterized protein n=1 Tax=Deinococcus oregonensis TaxID=1805970 RepID=A0ABV6B2W0_9DEIO
MKYTVRYTSVGGPLTGLPIGAEVEISDKQEADHLLGLGLIEKVKPASVKPAPAAKAKEGKV